MTNNHCPIQPIRIRVPADFEKKITEFATKMESAIAEFAEEYSMDEMAIIDSAILNTWTECPRCESAICEAQGNAYGTIIRMIMQHLNGEF